MTDREKANAIGGLMGRLFIALLDKSDELEATLNTMKANKTDEKLS
jgi:hypothetical protein